MKRSELMAAVAHLKHLPDAAGLSMCEECSLQILFDAIEGAVYRPATTPLTWFRKPCLAIVLEEEDSEDDRGQEARACDGG